MNKAEEYIKEHTRQCSNTFWDKNDGEYNCSWLTPDQARKAVEIAKEETIDKIKQLFEEKYLIKGTKPSRWVSWEKVFSDLKQAMK